MYDLHSHIIYGVDDGSPDAATSRELLKMAASCGTKHIIATPHVIELNNCPSWERINAGVAELKEMAAEEKLDLAIYTGAEIEMNWDILDVFHEGSRDYCLGGSRYALVELPAMSIPDYTEDFWYELQLKGICPVLAHPERHQRLMEHPERLLKWMRGGLLTQMNGGSITGRFGEHVKQNAEMLLKNDVICFIGSDAHRVKIRNTDLTHARQRLNELVGAEKAKLLCDINPQRLLADEDISVQLPQAIKRVEQKKKQSFWSKLFG